MNSSWKERIDIFNYIIDITKTLNLWLELNNRPRQWSREKVIKYQLCPKRNRKTLQAVVNKNFQGSKSIPFLPFDSLFMTVLSLIKSRPVLIVPPDHWPMVFKTIEETIEKPIFIVSNLK